METGSSSWIYRRRANRNDTPSRLTYTTRSAAPASPCSSTNKKEQPPVVTASLNSFPLDLLHAEIKRRQETEKPSCGTSGKQGHYNTGAHVFALFLILGLSTLGHYYLQVNRHVANHDQLALSRSLLVAFLSSQYHTASSFSRDTSEPAFSSRRPSSTSSLQLSSP